MRIASAARIKRLGWSLRIMEGLCRSLCVPAPDRSLRNASRALFVASDLRPKRTNVSRETFASLVCVESEPRKAARAKKAHPSRDAAFAPRPAPRAPRPAPRIRFVVADDSSRLFRSGMSERWAKKRQCSNKKIACEKIGSEKVIANGSTRRLKVNETGFEYDYSSH